MRADDSTTFPLDATYVENVGVSRQQHDETNPEIQNTATSLDHSSHLFPGAAGNLQPSVPAPVLRGQLYSGIPKSPRGSSKEQGASTGSAVGSNSSAVPMTSKINPAMNSEIEKKAL